MFCTGCAVSKRKIHQENHQQSVDSPLQIQLIKMFGLKNYIMENFVFRRKKPSYYIRNTKNGKIIQMAELVEFPEDYLVQVQIIEKGKHSIPVVKMVPQNIEQNQEVPCIIYCHGNASDMGDSIKFAIGLSSKIKAQFIVFDYTGYGASRKQQVGQEIIRADLQLVMAWSKRSLSQIILWGFSLGTYPVIYNAAKYRVKAIILLCPIGSISCMFYDEYSTNIKFNDDHFANIDYIKNVKSKILILHSTCDQIIPFEQAKLLYRKFVNTNTDKNIDFIEVEKIKHNSFHRYITSTKINNLQYEVFKFIEKSTCKGFYSTSQIKSQNHLSLLQTTIQMIDLQIEEQVFDQQQFEINQQNGSTQNTMNFTKTQGNFISMICSKR